jgi:ketosteroid isomerase-like protein
MSNADVIRTFVDAMNRHDIDALAACYAPDAAINYPGRPARNVTDYANDERGMLTAVPNYAIEATSILEAEGGHVILEITFRGTQREDLGGRSFEATGAYIFRLANGKIVEERAYPDTAGLRKQLSGR